MLKWAAPNWKVLWIHNSFIIITSAFNEWESCSFISWKTFHQWFQWCAYSERFGTKGKTEIMKGLFRGIRYDVTCVCNNDDIETLTRKETADRLSYDKKCWNFMLSSLLSIVFCHSLTKTHAQGTIKRKSRTVFRGNPSLGRLFFLYRFSWIARQKCSCNCSFSVNTIWIDVAYNKIRFVAP